MHEHAFERLYAQHAAGLFGFMLYRTGDRALAQDLVSDTFERVLRSRRRFNPRKGSEKNWIYSIALNVLRDHVRRRRVEERALARLATGDQGVAGDALEALEASDQVWRALHTLSSEEREVLALRFGAELTLPEISRLIDERLTTVKGRVYRAMEAVRKELAD